jgi:hypothetical protein
MEAVVIGVGVEFVPGALVLALFRGVNGNIGLCELDGAEGVRSNIEFVDAGVRRDDEIVNEELIITLRLREGGAAEYGE